MVQIDIPAGFVVSMLAIELGRLLGVHLAPLLQGAIAEVGGEIHHTNTTLKQLRCQLTGQTVGKTENSEIRRGGDAIGIGRFHKRIIRKRKERTH